jgi:uncharacterized protein (DUF3084 family)
MGKIQLEYNLKKAVSECKKAVSERDEAKYEVTTAVMENGKIKEELTEALEQYETAISEHDAVVAERYKLLSEHDISFNANDETKKLYADSLDQIKKLMEQLSTEVETRKCAERNCQS